MQRHLAVLFALGLGLCTAAQAQPKAGNHADYNGWWLKNAQAEAFVVAKPYPRVIAFRLAGKTSPLHVSDKYEYFGIRTWFFEPTQIPASGLPALQPATAQIIGERALRLTAAPDTASGLQLTMEIKLDDTAAKLHIRHGFKNHKTEKRRIAAWALNVINPDKGVGITRFKKDGPRSLLFWPNTDLDEKALMTGPSGMAVDYRILPRNGWFKVGTNTDAGWVAYVWDGMALKSSVAHVPNAEYPEDGGTITFFNSTSKIFDGNPRFGEIENVGPLSDLMPGNTLWMDQTLELVSDIQGNDPQAWIQQLDPQDKEK
jgi:hypothetical protein